uniref:hypothetical protein n=1 Tax=Altererythrobacter segetis TaxID=1104773 RepID=UPI001408B015|nr:hypothetical protein [Altererythrobacter segetis]
MKKLILLAGAAMLVTVAPAAAKPGNGHGQGHGNGNGHSAMAHGHSAPSMAHGNSGHARTVHGRAGVGLVRAGNGRLYALDRRGSCPPGLAKKGNGCMPPGQAKKLYNVGQRYNRNFGSLWSYNQIPDYLRNQYSFDQSDRYYYRDGYLYQVDPRTMLVQQAISALLR